MCPVFYGYLLEKIIKMRFNRIFADEQRTSDLVIRRADTQLIQDVIFQTFLFPLKRDFEKTVVFALIQTEEALNRRQINQALLSTGDLAHDEF